MKFMRTWWYFAFIALFIIPLNVAIISAGHGLLGGLLIATQLPWMINFSYLKFTGEW